MKISEVKELLSSMELKPLKSLGQNFLIDQNVIHKICAAEDLNSYDKVIEIGPGLGSLTRKFESFKEKVTLIELDKSLAAYWVKEGFNVLHQDALKYEWGGVQEKTILISNLPYQISSRLLIELFTLDHRVDAMVLMFQKEVGERIRATPEDKKTYGLLSIVCDLFWNVKTVVRAPRQCFYPSPEIESVVLSFHKKEGLEGVNRKDFVNHLKTLFAARRKKINTSFKKQNIEVKEEFKDLLQMRPDHLNPKEHLDLFKEISRG